jgi:hypothetical protein
MAKDKILGIILLILGVIVLVGYTIMGPVDLILASLGKTRPWDVIPGFQWEWALMIPMFIVVLIVCVVLLWIGYSMLTTPPPVPLEELEEELEREEESSK